MRVYTGDILNTKYMYHIDHVKSTYYSKINVCGFTSNLLYYAYVKKIYCTSCIPKLVATKDTDIIELHYIFRKFRNSSIITLREIDNYDIIYSDVNNIPINNFDELLSDELF